MNQNAFWLGVSLFFSAFVLVACPKGTDVKTSSSEAASENPAVAAQDGGGPEAPKAPEPARLVSSGGTAEQLFEEGVRIAAAQPQEAVQSFQKALDSDAKMYQAWYNIGVLQDRLGNPSASETAYRKALQLKPDFYEATLNLARLYLRQRRASDASYLLEEKSRNFPQNPEYQNALIYLYIHQGQLDRSEQMARSLREKNEKNAQAILNLGLVWYKQRKYELARTAFSLAADARKDLPEPHYYLGFAYRKLNDPNTAADHLKKAVGLRDAYPEAHNLLGVVLLGLGKVPEAIPHFRKAIQWMPSMLEAQLNLGIALKESQKYQEAADTFRRILRENAGYGEAHYNLGILFLDHPIQGERSANADQFARSIPPDLQSEKRLFELADVLSRCATAIHHLRFYLNQQSSLPSDAPARNYLQEAEKKLDREKKTMERRIVQIRKQRLRDAQRKARAKPKPTPAAPPPGR